MALAAVALSRLQPTRPELGNRMAARIARNGLDRLACPQTDRSLSASGIEPPLRVGHLLARS